MRAESGRIHSMDALRASTMLLLVPVHAAILLELNGHPGAWATAIYWVVHVFRLPLFFAMSGFFMALLLTRKGLEQTTRSRTLRIMIPLGVGLLTLVPLLQLAESSTGLVTEVGEPPATGSSVSLEPAFLWFLWYLLIMDAAAIALYVVAPASLARAGGAIRRAIERPLLGMLALAAPTALTLWPEAGWTQIPDAATFVPEVQAMAYFGLFFALGATLFANPGLVAEVARDAWRWTGRAVAAAIPAAALFTLHNSPHGERPVVHAAALLVYAFATWASLLALVGLATRYMNRPQPALRYIADSSYWIYLSHLLPMVLLVAILGTALGPFGGYAIVTLGSLAASLATYQLFVRHTPIGHVLNGRRRRRGPPWRRALRRSASAPTQPAAAAERPA